MKKEFFSELEYQEMVDYLLDTSGKPPIPERFIRTKRSFNFKRNFERDERFYYDHASKKLMKFQKSSETE
jgi:hypothetical protein